MDDDLIKAIIAALLADSVVAGFVTDRVYPAAQVTPSDPFPRGYVGQVRSPIADQWSEGGTYLTRYPLFSIEWATTNAQSITAQQDVETLDARAFALLRGLAATNVIYLQRHTTIPAHVQTDANLEFVTAGGLWIARREYDYS